MGLSCVPFGSHAIDRWNAVVAESDDGWFWQTSHWMEWAEERGRANLVANDSFFVVDDGDVLAVCPALIEHGAHGVQLGYCGAPLPAPALKRGLSRAGRQRVLERYAATLADIAFARDVKYVSVVTPTLCPAHLESGLPVGHPLVRLGYFEVPRLTQVIDLRAPLERLWSDVRKGHKADIKTAERACRVHVWDASTVTDERVRAYAALHAKDAGGAVRSPRTFQLMGDWIRNGMGALVEVEYDGRPVAFALQLLYKRGAYYGSACKDPDHVTLPASHLAQWASIRWLTEHGFEFYEVGPQPFGPQWFEVPSAKEVGIARFKRGFGGQPVRLPIAEFFYSRALFEDVFARRMRAYVDAAAPVEAAR